MQALCEQLEIAINANNREIERVVKEISGHLEAINKRVTALEAFAERMGEIPDGYSIVINPSEKLGK